MRFHSFCCQGRLELRGPFWKSTTRLKSMGNPEMPVEREERRSATTRRWRIGSPPTWKWLRRLGISSLRRQYFVACFNDMIRVCLDDSHNYCCLVRSTFQLSGNTKLRAKEQLSFYSPRFWLSHNKYVVYIFIDEGLLGFPVAACQVHTGHRLSRNVQSLMSMFSIEQASSLK